MVAMVLVFIVGTFGANFQLTTALLAKQVFHRSAAGYGLLSTSLAIARAHRGHPGDPATNPAGCPAADRGGGHLWPRRDGRRADADISAHLRSLWSQRA